MQTERPAAANSQSKSADVVCESTINTPPMHLPIDTRRLSVLCVLSVGAVMVLSAAADGVICINGE